MKLRMNTLLHILFKKKESLMHILQNLIPYLHSFWYSYSFSMIQEIWNRAAIHPDFDPSCFRQDPYGSIIRFADYNCKKSDYGWYIGPKIHPLWAGDKDMYDKLRPVQLKNRKRHEQKWNPVIIV